jgi:uncharacterized membrane protein HdeD (DUF308 family)
MPPSPDATPYGSPEAVDPVARARRQGVLTWVWLAVSGGLCLVLGLVSILSPATSLRVLAVVLSLLLMGIGLSRIALAVGVRGWGRGRRLVQGVLGGALAVLGLTGLAGLWSAVTLVGVVVGLAFVATGLADLVTAATGPRGLGRAATGSLGVVHVVVGLVFLFLPEVGLTVLAVLVGVVLVGLGLLQLGAAWLVRLLVRQADALAAPLRQDGTGGPGRLGGPEDGDGRVVRGEVI